jgi:hypothetical protein
MELPRQYRRKEMPTFKWWLVAISEYDDEMVDNSDLLAVSKFNWFIKWLVDNDKIKLWAYDVEWYHFNIHTYLDLIMLLSISDTPIDDLINYLK